MEIVLALFVASSGVYFFYPPVADNDLWGHVVFGRHILESGLFPSINRYSYTAPSFPVINHETLAECLFALVYGALGSSGLVALKVGVGLATLAIIAHTIRRRAIDPAAAIPVLIASASLMSFGYMVRPQIFTFLALAILWDRLHADAHDATGPGIWFLPVLFAVWVNTHGGVLAGLAVLALYAVVRAVGSRGRRAWPSLLVTAACLGALFVNPYGTDLPLFLARDVLVDRPITEWASISLTDLSNLHFKVVVALLVVGVSLDRRSPAWEVVIVAVAAIAALRHERHLPLFAVLAAPLLASLVSRALAAATAGMGLARLSLGARTALLVGCFGLVGVQSLAIARMVRATRGEILVSPRDYPVEAIRFIEENGLRGNIAVPFGWGEYAIWHLFPECPVSVDGRYTTAYPHDVLEDAWRFMEGRKGWDTHLRDASFALVDRKHATAGLLGKRRDWRQIHADDTAIVYARADLPLPEPLRKPKKVDPRRSFFP